MFDPIPDDKSGQPNQPDVTFTVGNREYKISDAVTKIEHADQHISTLEQELKTLREQLALTEAQREALKALGQQNPAPQPAPTSQAPTLNMEDVLAQAEERVFQKLSQRQKAEVKGQNLTASTDAARTVYGDSYQQELRKRGQELGMTDQDIVEFASTKPEAFKTLFGLNTQTRSGPLPISSYSGMQQKAPDPIRQVAKIVIDPKASGRQRTDAIAQALKGLL